MLEGDAHRCRFQCPVGAAEVERLFPVAQVDGVDGGVETIMAVLAFEQLARTVLQVVQRRQGDADRRGSGARFRALAP